jgi:hypothetical protein
VTDPDVESVGLHTFAFVGGTLTIVNESGVITELDDGVEVVVNTDGSFTCSCNAGFILNADGFLRQKQVTEYSKAKRKIREKLVLADEDEREDLEDELELEKEFKIDKMYGICGHLALSGRNGIFTGWTDEAPLKKTDFDKWDGNPKVTKADKSEWGIDVSRTRKNKESFAKW